MPPFFGDKNNIRVFSDGFDLLGDHAGSQVLADICIDLKGVTEEDDDFFPAFFSLEGLYTSLNMDLAAIDLISGNCFLLENPIFRFRYADHCSKAGKSARTERIFRSYLTEEPRYSRDILSGLLSAGRLHDPAEVARRWNMMLREGPEDIPVNDAFLQSPDEYVLLSSHQFRERIEAVRLLARENIPAGREKEAYSVVHSLVQYLRYVGRYLAATVVEEGATKTLPGIRIAVMMADTSCMVTKEFREAGLFPTTVLQRSVEKILKELQNAMKDSLFLQLFIENILAGRDESVILTNMRCIVGNQDLYLVPSLQLLKNCEFKQQASSLLCVLQKDNEGLEIGDGYSPGYLKSLRKFREDFRYRYEDEDSVEEDTELESLLSEGRYDEAFTLVAGYIQDQVIFEDIGIVFDLAVKSGRLDELIPLRPFMEEAEIRDGVYLIRAYEQLIKKDLKGCLALVDRAVSAGYPEEEAMILTAAYLNTAGFPKRAVGICEKLLKNPEIVPDDIIPVLAAAYRLQGKEREAAEVETLPKR